MKLSLQKQHRQFLSKSLKIFWRRRLRYFLLLEVLIAFALVVLAVLPLVYPHYYIYQQQRAFIDKIDLDIAVNLIYVKLMERLYKNEIPWTNIHSDREFPIDESFLEQVGYTKKFPYNGTYQFHLIKTKKNPQYALNSVMLTLRFNPKIIKKDSNDHELQKNRMVYEYKVFIAQQFKMTIPETVSP